jgi:hypothetical protein
MPLKFVEVLVAMFLTDICWSMYFHYSHQANFLKAAAWNTFIIAFSSFVVVEYTQNPILIVAACIGGFAGTALTVWWNNRKKP